MVKRVIILGSSGFIGSWLSSRFSEEGYEVVGYSSKECDLLSPDSIVKALSSVAPDDCIIISSCISRLTENSLSSMTKNISMIENISKFLIDHPVRHITFLSSVDVYGFVKPSEKISETLLPGPRDYYSVSKLVSEYLLKNMCSKTNTPLLVLRLSGIYGEGDEGKSTINKLITSAIKSGEITVFGSGDDKRDFVYVDDVYRIIKSGMTNTTAGTVNVATGDSYTIKQIATLIKSLCDNPVTIKSKPVGKNVEKRAKDLVYDTSFRSKTFPQVVFTPLREGINLYFDTYR